jgi:hypothetical protein
MEIVSTVKPSLCDDFDEIIDDAIAGVSDTFNMVCGLNDAWLSTLHDDLDPAEARFIVLLMIAHKARAISERALSLLAEQRRDNPALQALMDDLADDDEDTEGAPAPGCWIAAPIGEA